MLNDDEFRQILHYFNRPWAGFRKVRKAAKKRLRRHMTELGCPTVEAYLTHLDRHTDAKIQCERCLLVTISRFFRDRKLWSHMQTHTLPKLAARFPVPIRFWSAGCASGEEPYSLAISWQTLPLPPPMALLATDIRPDCLERARHGVYNKSSLKEVDDEMRTQYFAARRGGRQYVLQQHLLPPIQWQQRHLLDSPPAGMFQMILLRNNLLTYYQGETLHKAFRQIVQTLSPKGYLVIGSHEHLPETEESLTQDPKCPWLYQYVSRAPRTFSNRQKTAT